MRLGLHRMVSWFRSSWSWLWFIRNIPRPRDLLPHDLQYELLCFETCFVSKVFGQDRKLFAASSIRSKSHIDSQDGQEMSQVCHIRTNSVYPDPSRSRDVGLATEEQFCFPFFDSDLDVQLLWALSATPGQFFWDGPGRLPPKSI